MNTRSIQRELNLRHQCFHQNEGLLFQFILSEFHTAFSKIQLLNKIKKIRLNKSAEAILSSLAGSSREYMRFFSWNTTDGILFKLKNYCTLFSQNSGMEEKEILALLYYADKAWLYSIQSLDILRDSNSTKIELEVSLDKMKTALERFSRLLLKIIPQFQDDENVLYYILKNYLLFDNYYGAKFTSKLFQTLFSNDLREANLFLTKKYSDRGFYNVLPSINHYVLQLEESS